MNCSNAAPLSPASPAVLSAEATGATEQESYLRFLENWNSHRRPDRPRPPAPWHLRFRPHLLPG